MPCPTKSTRCFWRLCSRLSVRPLLVALALCAAGHVAAQDEGACGNPFANHFGPFDYRTATRENLQLVENAHFTPGVESLTRPATTTMEGVAKDIGYTLHVFPNHHRALITMMRLAEQRKTDQPKDARFTVDCYLQRAVRYRPNDTVARALYAQYLAKRGMKAAALDQLRIATQQAKDNPFSHYNIGLLYMEMSEHELALAQAHKAKELGFPRLELEQALKKVGKWKDAAEGVEGTSQRGPAEPASAPAR